MRIDKEFIKNAESQHLRTMLFLLKRAKESSEAVKSCLYYAGRKAQTDVKENIIELATELKEREHQHNINSEIDWEIEQEYGISI